MGRQIHNLQIRVLIYREDGEWVARALEMDLLGFGKTEREAVGELQQAVEAQISFAHQTNDASLINFPAEPEFFKRWEVAQKKAMRSEILGDKSVKLAVRSPILSETIKLNSVHSRRFADALLNPVPAAPTRLKKAAAAYWQRVAT